MVGIIIIANPIIQNQDNMHKDTVLDGRKEAASSELLYTLYFLEFLYFI
jgi:hypothetical protein